MPVRQPARARWPSRAGRRAQRHRARPGRACTRARRARCRARTRRYAAVATAASTGDRPGTPEQRVDQRALAPLGLADDHDRRAGELPAAQLGSRSAPASGRRVRRNASDRRRPRRAAGSRSLHDRPPPPAAAGTAGGSRGGRPARPGTGPGRRRRPRTPATGSPPPGPPRPARRRPRRAGAGSTGVVGSGQPGQLLLPRPPAARTAPVLTRCATSSSRSRWYVGLLQHPLDRVAQHLPVGAACRRARRGVSSRRQRPAGLDRVGAPPERLVEGVPQPREPGRLVPAAAPAHRCPAAGRRRAAPARSRCRTGRAAPAAARRCSRGTGAGRGAEQVDRGQQHAQLGRGSAASCPQRGAVGGGEPAGLAGLGEQPDHRHHLGDRTRRSSAACSSASGPATGHGSPAPPTRVSTLPNTPERVDRAADASRADAARNASSAAHVVGADRLGEHVDDGLGARRRLARSRRRCRRRTARWRRSNRTPPRAAPTRRVSVDASPGVSTTVRSRSLLAGQGDVDIRDPGRAARRAAAGSSRRRPAAGCAGCRRGAPRRPGRPVPYRNWVTTRVHSPTAVGATRRPISALTSVDFPAFSRPAIATRSGSSSRCRICRTWPPGVRRSRPARPTSSQSRRDPRRASGPTPDDSSAGRTVSDNVLTTAAGRRRHDGGPSRRARQGVDACRTTALRISGRRQDPMFVPPGHRCPPAAPRVGGCVPHAPGTGVADRAAGEPAGTAPDDVVAPPRPAAPPGLVVLTGAPGSRPQHPAAQLAAAVPRPASTPAAAWPCCQAYPRWPCPGRCGPGCPPTTPPCSPRPSAPGSAAGCWSSTTCSTPTRPPSPRCRCSPRTAGSLVALRTPHRLPADAVDRAAAAATGWLRRPAAGPGRRQRPGPPGRTAPATPPRRVVRRAGGSLAPGRRHAPLADHRALARHGARPVAAPRDADIDQVAYAIADRPGRPAPPRPHRPGRPRPARPPRPGRPARRRRRRPARRRPGHRPPPTAPSPRAVPANGSRWRWVPRRSSTLVPRRRPAGELVAPTSTYVAEIAAGLLDPAARAALHRRLAELTPDRRGGPAPRRRRRRPPPRTARALAAADQAGTAGERADLLLFACDLPGVTGPPTRPGRRRGRRPGRRPAPPRLRVLAGRAAPLGVDAAVLRGEALLQAGDPAGAPGRRRRPYPTTPPAAGRRPPATGSCCSPELATDPAGAARRPPAGHGDAPAPRRRLRAAARRGPGRRPRARLGARPRAAAAAAATGRRPARRPGGAPGCWWRPSPPTAGSPRPRPPPQPPAAACADRPRLQLADPVPGRRHCGARRCAATRPRHRPTTWSAGPPTSPTGPCRRWPAATPSPRPASSKPTAGCSPPPGPASPPPRRAPAAAALLDWVAREAAWLDGQPDRPPPCPDRGAAPPLLDGLRQITARWAALRRGGVDAGPGRLDATDRRRAGPAGCPRSARPWPPGGHRTGFTAAAGLARPAPSARRSAACSPPACTRPTRTRAVAALLAAEHLAEPAGLVVLLGRARRALRRHAVRRDTRGPRAGAELTDRERDVLRLVAAGRTDPPDRRAARHLRRDRRHPHPRRHAQARRPHPHRGRRPGAWSTLRSTGGGAP